MGIQIHPRQIMNINPGESWKFDQQVAKEFVDHAKHHIPNYDLVTDKSVSVAKQRCNSDSKILDFGCATGYTLKKFHDAGFYNLYGIDNSIDMLDYCDPSLATYQLSDNVDPSFKGFDLITSNWTLQFVDDKLSVLQNIFGALNSNGVFILSEKISNRPDLISHYHDWKRDQGVSEEIIQQKQQSLEGVLKLQSHEWWIDTLKSVGYKSVDIIDAHWCFCTYMAIK